MVRARGPPTICLADHSIATALPSDSPDDIQAAIEGVPREVLAHVIDVHCHPTDSDMAMTDKVADDMAIRVCAMATRRSDQKLVADLARAHPDKVVPCFGWCPVLRVPRPSLFSSMGIIVEPAFVVQSLSSLTLLPRYVG